MTNAWMTLVLAREVFLRELAGHNTKRIPEGGKSINFSLAVDKHPQATQATPAQYPKMDKDTRPAWHNTNRS